MKFPPLHRLKETCLPAAVWQVCHGTSKEMNGISRVESMDSALDYCLVADLNFSFLYFNQFGLKLPAKQTAASPPFPPLYFAKSHVFRTPRCLCTIIESVLARSPRSNGKGEKDENE
jgi:hypothetical protein